MNKIRLTLPSFLINLQDVFHIVRRTISSNENLEYHEHDYAEIFWVKEGGGIHIINGEKKPIQVGHICMIRPGDAHTFKSTGTTTGLVITNIAFHLESLKLFKERYFPDSNSYFWIDNKLPYSNNLNTEQLNELSGITDYIISSSRDYMNLDILILHIFKILGSSEFELNSDIPHWLQYAMIQYNTPQKFRSGVPGFVALTDRSTDHVNKTIKLYLNQTLTETVTKIKMNYASQRLIMTNVPIKTICYNCGYDAISHFYKAFKKHSGMTPKEFRQLNHKVF